MDPNLIELHHADYLTIGTIGEPGKRTFFLQAAQEDLIVSLIIEKEQATALAVAISSLLVDTSTADDAAGGEFLDLIHPVRPLFRVGKLSLGQDERRDMLVIIAEALVAEGEAAPTVHIWASHEQMAALARAGVVAVASGRPICLLCHEVIDPREAHVCIRGNGRKRVE